MANKANAENVGNSTRPPDARYAVQMCREVIEKKRARISGVNGEIADVFAKIEGRGINKKAAKAFIPVDKMEPEERADFIRSFNLMCDAAGWEQTVEDLADRAEGKVTPLRVVNPAAPREPTDADGFFDPAAAIEGEEEGEEIEDDIEDDIEDEQGGDNE